jgi:hypothetical protein
MEILDKLYGMEGVQVFLHKLSLQGKRRVEPL